MTGKQLVCAAIRGQQVDRIPWVPFVGVHGGLLIGVPADAYLRDAKHIVAGIGAAVKRYRPDGIPSVFDLQIEAELLGCQLRWSKDTPPAVVSHPLTDGVKLGDLKIPAANTGRLAVAMDATRQLRANHPDLALYGLITGPFTLALHLMGTDIFMKMFDAPQEVNDTLAFCGKVCKAMAGYYVDAGCDIVAVVDPMTSQIGPDQFRQFVSDSVTDLLAHVRTLGALGSFFVCGHAEQNLQVMCECRPDNVSVDENIPLGTVRDICLPRGVSFGGNLQLTSVLLLGKPLDAQRNALDCLSAGGERGFVLAPGCDLPYATPPDNLAAVAAVVHDPYERQKVRALAVETVHQDLLDMSQYGQSDKVIVDIITLDSEACAPCQYMVESVRQITPEFEDVVEWREHKIKHPESLVFMTSLMVRNIPTICIDGQITFVSRIPAREELVAAIQKRIVGKLRARIAQKQGEVFVLCSAEHCKPETRQALEALVHKASAELGAQVPVRVIDDPDQIVALGVLPSQTPALVTARYQVRSTRTLPDKASVREWLKAIL